MWAPAGGTLVTPESPWHLVQLSSLAEVCFGSKALRDREKHTQSMFSRACQLWVSDVRADHSHAGRSPVLEVSQAPRPGQWLGKLKVAVPGHGNSTYKGSDAGDSRRPRGSGGCTETRSRIFSGRGPSCGPPWDWFLPQQKVPGRGQKRALAWSSTFLCSPARLSFPHAPAGSSSHWSSPLALSSGTGNSQALSVHLVFGPCLPPTCASSVSAHWKPAPCQPLCFCPR